jgi:methanogenic corrinoid protein MtbC1
MPLFEEMQHAIIDGKVPVVKELTQKALTEGVKPADIFPKAIVPAMDEVGRRMRDCEFFIPEVLIAARAARAATDILRPLLVGEAAMRSVGTVVCCTVKGDLHDIGKNIVSMMLESEPGGHVGVADHHDGKHEGRDRGPRCRRLARAGEGDGWRRARDRELGAIDRG